MKRPHPTAKLASDLTRQILKLTPGSDAWAQALKALANAAWDQVLTRNVEWPLLGSKTRFQYIVNAYEATPSGPVLSYRTPGKPTPARIPDSHYVAKMRKYGAKTRLQYCHTCNWIFEQFTAALAMPALPGRAMVRCLTVRNALDQATHARLAELEARMSGSTPGAGGRLEEFASRHPEGFHIFRDHYYATLPEVTAAIEADSKALPLDHDKIVGLWEASLLPNGIDEEQYTALGQYLNSTEHKEALQESERLGANPRLLSKHDKTLRQIVKAGWTLERTPDATIDGASYNTLSKLLGLSRPYFTKIMGNTKRTKPGIRAALRARVYELAPSRRPRKKKTAQSKVDAEIRAFRNKLPPEVQAKFDAVMAEKDPGKSADLELELEKLLNPFFPCKPGCKCIRHNATATA